jgi:hypothetical protein
LVSHTCGLFFTDALSTSGTVPIPGGEPRFAAKIQLNFEELLVNIHLSLLTTAVALPCTFVFGATITQNAATLTCLPWLLPRIAAAFVWLQYCFCLQVGAAALLCTCLGCAVHMATAFLSSVQHKAKTNLWQLT